MNCFLFLQYGLHDDLVEILPRAILWIHWVPRFWLKPFSAQNSFFFVCFLSIRRKSNFCGSQGMKFDGRSQWVGPNHSRAAVPFSMVAEVLRAETNDWLMAEPSESRSKVPTMPRQSGTSTSAISCKEQDRSVRTCIGRVEGAWMVVQCKPSSWLPRSFR